MNNTTLNSFLYEMYKVKLQYGYLIDDMEEIQESFDLFYKLLYEEEFISCKTILLHLENQLGNSNSDVVRARTCLEYEI